MENDLLKQVLPSHLVRKFVSDSRNYPAINKPDALYNGARGWKFVQDIVDGDTSIEDPYTEMHEALAHIEWTGVDISTYNAKLSKDLFRYKRAYYVYLSLYPQAVPKWDDNDRDSHLPKILMVAEKPSVAKTIAETLSNGRMRMKRNCVSRACLTHEFICYFPPAGQRCSVMCTSVVGHVFGLDFADKSVRDPGKLYSTATQKVIESTTAKLKVVEHLQDLAQECEYLALWLDCDREGENICFEVMSVCREQFPTDENVYRAHFSALTQIELQHAWDTLRRPNKYLAMAVDARQELDLKVGVSFTRLLTRALLEKAKKKFYWDLHVISYGPCQTPSLWFCTARAFEIEGFERTRYWKPTVYCDLGRSRQSALFEWEHGTTEDFHVKQKLDGVFQREKNLHVHEIRKERKTIQPPPGLNTVQLLKSASTGMGMSPAAAMKVAEHLYTSGFISYPRTESSRYPDTFDVRAVLQEQSWHPQWGRTAQYILRGNNNIRPPVRGNDAGDHPPITPMRCAARDEITKGKEWKLYDFITRHFIASMMGPFEYDEFKVEAYIGNEAFNFYWHTIIDHGFIRATPWKEKDYGLNIVAGGVHLQAGTTLRISHADVSESWTKPPDFLKESELIHLMDANGIGTDASIPQHVQNICDRRYVEVRGPGENGHPGALILSESQEFMKRKKDPNAKQEPPKSRHMVPTSLGKALITAYTRLDKSLCEPSVRAYMEQQVKQIAEGELSKQEVVDETIDIFEKKFIQFRENFATVFEPIFRVNDMGSYRDYGNDWGDSNDWGDWSQGNWGKGEASGSKGGQNTSGKTKGGKNSSGKSKGGKSKGGKNSSGKTKGGKNSSGKSKGGKSKGGKDTSGKSKGGKNSSGKSKGGKSWSNQ